jgi:hypothetical protein
VCAPTPGVEVVEDANGREFVSVSSVVELDGALYLFFPQIGFVPSGSEPGNGTSTYHRSVDCSGPEFVLTDPTLRDLDPDSVFDGWEYRAGAWDDQVWARVSTPRGETAMRYWRLDGTSSLAELSVGSTYENGSCNTNQQTFNGEVAYEVVWGELSVTETFTPPFSRVFGASSGGLCFAEINVPGEVTASAEVVEAVC